MARKLAVVLSGGGSKGAFQVGALDELVKRGVKFDLWVGTSTGAIQAVAGAMNRIPDLVALWLSLQNNRDIYLDRLTSLKGWLRMVLGGLTSGGPLARFDALYDTAPLRAKMSGFVLDDKVTGTGKELRICVASLQSGKVDHITQKDVGLADWVYASCAEPVYFEPHWARRAADDHEQWVDGGVRDITPLGLAMKGAADRILVIGTNSPKDFQSVPGRQKDVIAIGLRTLGILLSEILHNDVEHANDINKLLLAREAMREAGATAEMLAPLDAIIADKRFVPIVMIEPEDTVSQSLEFDNRAIRAGIEAGRAMVRDHWTDGKKLKDFLLEETQGEQQHGQDRELVAS